MFDIGWPEMLVVAVVLIVIVGPKDLPGMLRNFGRTTSKLRAMAGDFRKQFDEALKEAELDDVKGVVDDVRKLNPAADLRKALNPMRQAAEDMRSGLDSAMKPNAHPQNAKEAAEARAAAAAANSTPATSAGETKSKPAAKTTNAKKSASTAGKSSSTKQKAPATKAATAKSGTQRSAGAKTAAAKTGAAKKVAPAKTAAAKPAAKPKAAPKKRAAATTKGGKAS